MYVVIATVREVACSKYSRIIKLLLDREYCGKKIHDLRDLKRLADVGLLFVKLYRPYCKNVLVRITWNNGQFVASTNPDNVTCNNLLNLPIVNAHHENWGFTGI